MSLSISPILTLIKPFLRTTNRFFETVAYSPLILKVGKLEMLIIFENRKNRPDNPQVPKRGFKSLIDERYLVNSHIYVRK